MTMRELPDPNEQSERAMLSTLTRLVDEADHAALRISQYLLAVHASHHWAEVTYEQLGNSMSCSRQAVQERMARLLANGSDVRRHRDGAAMDPNQLRLT